MPHVSSAGPVEWNPARRAESPLQTARSITARVPTGPTGSQTPTVPRSGRSTPGTIRHPPMAFSHFSIGSAGSTEANPPRRPQQQPGLTPVEPVQMPHVSSAGPVEWNPARRAESPLQTARSITARVPTGPTGSQTPTVPRSGRSTPGTIQHTPMAVSHRSIGSAGSTDVSDPRRRPLAAATSMVIVPATTPTVATTTVICPAVPIASGSTTPCVLWPAPPSPFR